MSTVSEMPPGVESEVDQVVERSQVAIIVPTLNARGFWKEFQSGLAKQRFRPDQVLIVDSSSEDGTPELAAAEGYNLLQIDRREFNHGGTRQLALEHVPWATFVVYLTQDAILAGSSSIDLLLAAFRDPKVGAAYGRQLPRASAGPIEAHARLFNYPATSEVRGLESRHTLGIRAAFLSNSFAAYRVSALLDGGGFPRNAILSEDAIATANLLIMGWKTAYVAEAQVHHSHAFTTLQEFRRYFDIGVAHSRELWLRDLFGKPREEGQRFVISELRYLRRHNSGLIPSALLRTAAKGLGYKLGLRAEALGRSWCRRLSYHQRFWDSPMERLRENQTQPGGHDVSSSHIRTDFSR